MCCKVKWHLVSSFETGDCKIVWAWDGEFISLAIAFQAWGEDSDSVVFQSVDTGGTMRTEIPGVILWTDVVVPESP